MNKCECRVCQRNSRVMDMIHREKLIDADKQELSNILTELLHAETDAEYYKLKYLGKWPTQQTKVEQRADNSDYAAALRVYKEYTDAKYKCEVSAPFSSWCEERLHSGTNVA